MRPFNIYVRKNKDIYMINKIYGILKRYLNSFLFPLGNQQTTRALQWTTSQNISLELFVVFLENFANLLMNVHEKLTSKRLESSSKYCIAFEIPYMIGRNHATICKSVHAKFTQSSLENCQ